MNTRFVLTLLALIFASPLSHAVEPSRVGILQEYEVSTLVDSSPLGTGRWTNARGVRSRSMACGLRVVQARRPNDSNANGYLAIVFEGPSSTNDLNIPLALTHLGTLRARVIPLLVELDRPVTTRSDPLSTSYEYCVETASSETVDCSAPVARTRKRFEVIVDQLKISSTTLLQSGEVASQQVAECNL